MKRIWLAAFLVALALVGGCSKGSGNNSASTRVLHASLDTEAFDILVDTNVKATAVSYKSATGYSDFGSGSHTVVVRSSVSGATLLTKTVSFVGGNQTLVVYGRRSTLSVLVLPDDVSTGPASGNFQVRVIGLSPDVCAVDLYLAPGSVTSAPATIAGAGYSSATGYAELAAGSFPITFTPAGLKNILFQSPAQTFSAGSVNTVVVFPAYSGTLVNGGLLTTGTNASGTFFGNANSRVKTANAVANSNQLNLLVDGATLFSGVPYKGISTYVTTAAGSRALQLQASAVPGATIATLGLVMAPAQDYSVLSLNTLAQPRLVALVDDNTVPVTGYAKVRFVNATLGNSGADALVDFATQASGIAPGTASAYSQIIAGDTYTVTFTTPGGVSNIATLSPVQLLSGAVYSMYLYGTAGTDAEIRLTRDR
jgi:hypothetical protein